MTDEMQQPSEGTVANDDKLKAIELKKQKHEQALAKLREDEKRIKRQQAKKAKAIRDEVHRQIGSIVVNNSDSLNITIERLVSVAQANMSEKAFEKFKEGLVSDGIMRVPD